MSEFTHCSIVHRGLSSGGGPVSNLNDRGNWCDRRGDTKVTVGSLLRAFARDVAILPTLVASLAGSVKGSTVGGSAVARNMSELSARIAFHGLRLAISCEVVGTTALVASSWAGSAEPTTGNKSAVESTARSTNATSGAWNSARDSWVGAGTSEMARLSARVASATGPSSTETESWAITLHMS
jgi:hypothetical protein